MTTELNYLHFEREYCRKVLHFNEAHANACQRISSNEILNPYICNYKRNSKEKKFVKIER